MPTPRALVASASDPWVAVRIGRHVVIRAASSSEIVGSIELDTDDAELVFAGPPCVLVAIAAGPASTQVVLRTVPELASGVQVELEPGARLAAVAGARLVFVTRDRQRLAIVREAGAAVASRVLEIGSTIDFVVGLDRDQLLLGTLRGLEAWDAGSGRRTLRAQLRLPPPPLRIGAAAGYLWAVQPGSEHVLGYRLSDRRRYEQAAGAAIEDVIAHPASPVLVLVTRAGLARLHCHAFTLAPLTGTPYTPGVALAQVVEDTTARLVGLGDGDHEPWRVELGRTAIAVRARVPSASDAPADEVDEPPPGVERPAVAPPPASAEPARGEPPPAPSGSVADVAARIAAMRGATRRGPVVAPARATTETGPARAITEASPEPFEIRLSLALARVQQARYERAGDDAAARDAARRADELRARLRAVEPGGPMAHLAADLALSDAQLELAWMVVACTADPRLGAHLEAVLGPDARHGLSPSGYATMFPDDPAVAALLREPITDHPLVRVGLLELVGDNASPIFASLVASRALVAHLAGRPHAPAHAVRLEPGGRVPLARRAAVEELRGMLAGPAPCAVVVEGPRGAGRRTAIAQAAAALGRGALAVDLRRLAPGAAALREALDELRREAVLARAIPVVAGLDVLVGGIFGHYALHELGRLLDGASGPVALTAEAPGLEVFARIPVARMRWAGSPPRSSAGSRS